MNKRTFQQLIDWRKSAMSCKKCGGRVATTTEEEERFVAGERVLIHWVIDVCGSCGYESYRRSH